MAPAQAEWARMEKAKSDIALAFAEVFDKSWEGAMIEVDPLIKMLGESADRCLTDEQSAKFFEATDIELRRISKIYSNTAMSLKLSDDNGRLGGQRIIPRIMTSIRVGRGYKVSATVQNVFIHTVLTTTYAQLSRDTLRALAGLHDARANNSKGAKYLEEVWSAGDERGLFLHSALLRELEALYIIMASELGQAKAGSIDPLKNSKCDSLRVKDSPPSFSLTTGDRMDTLHTLKEDMTMALPPKTGINGKQLSEGDDLPSEQATLMSCPVCLEFMYRPHGLSCGHCMCTPCLLVANKMANAVAPSVKALMSNLPYRQGKCAICRQVVTEPPMELTALGRLVSSKVPNHYQACHTAFEEKQTRLMAKYESQIAQDLGLNENPLAPAFKNVKEKLSNSITDLNNRAAHTSQQT